MSEKNMSLPKSLMFMVLFLFVVCATACDPCRKLAERICSCKETEEERRQCSKELSIAKSHKYYKDARNEEQCAEALLDCSCPELLKGNDQKCGVYREKK